MGVALAADVSATRRALSDTAAATMQDHAASAGRILGSEFFRRSREMRYAMFEPAVRSSLAPVPLDVAGFARHAESLYAATHNPGDPQRGVLVIDVPGSIVTWGARPRDPLTVRAVEDTLAALAPSLDPTPRDGRVIIRHPGRPTTSIWYLAVRTRERHRRRIYAVTHSRAHHFASIMARTIASVPLLPPSYSGAALVVDGAAEPARGAGNAGVLAVRVTDSDGTPLFGSPSLPDGGPSASFAFRPPLGGFAIETTLREDMERVLVPAARLERRHWSHVALAATGVTFLFVSVLAYLGEIAARDAARASAMRELAIGIRHEMNNALTTVLLEAQILARDPGTTDDARRTADAIAAQVHRMGEALERLDKAESLPVVPYVAGVTMVDVTAAGELPDHPVNTTRR